MTKTIITSYTTFLCIAVLMAGTAITQASNVGSEVTGTLSSDTTKPSEVTGTISSDTASDSETDGNLTSTVSGDSADDGNLSGTVSDDSAAGNLSGTVSESTDSENSGRLQGTVSSGSASSETITGTVSGGSRSSGGGTSQLTTDSTSDSEITTAPSGAVLGEATRAAQSPGFPNAGTAPQASSADRPLWSVLMNFLINLLPN